MGSYATLEYGDFGVGEWKNHIPFEPLLLFTSEDFRSVSMPEVLDEEVDEDEEEEEESLDEEEEDIRPKHKFVTTVAQAKKRLDARGLTLAVCRRLFEEFKSSTLFEWDSESDEGVDIPNDIDFDRFLELCREAYAKHKTWYMIGSLDKPTNPDLEKIFQEGFFDETKMFYFDDVFTCIIMRTFLEVALPDAEVAFDLTDVIEGGYVELEDVSRLYDDYMALIMRRIGLDYQLYGFVVEDDPNLDRRQGLRIKILS